MAIKVTPEVLARIIELREKYGLTQAVIATRMGLATRTVRLYLSEHRKSKQICACDKFRSPHDIAEHDPDPDYGF